jgi:hypothetical protein
MPTGSESLLLVAPGLAMFYIHHPNEDLIVSADDDWE